VGYAPLENGLQMLQLASEDTQSGHGLELGFIDGFDEYALAVPFTAPALGRSVSYTTIHRRLGHLGLSYVEKVAKIARGIDLKGLTIPEYTSEACVAAQQSVNPRGFQCGGLLI
jgi:hypothetical protein